MLAAQRQTQLGTALSVSMCAYHIPCHAAAPGKTEQYNTYMRRDHGCNIFSSLLSLQNPNIATSGAVALQAVSEMRYQAGTWRVRLKKITFLILKIHMKKPQATTETALILQQNDSYRIVSHTPSYPLPRNCMCYSTN